MSQSSTQLHYQITSQHAAMCKEYYGEKSEQYDKALVKQIEAEENLFEWGESVMRSRPEWEQVEPIFYAVEPEHVAKVIALLMKLDADEVTKEPKQEVVEDCKGETKMATTKKPTKTQQAVLDMLQNGWIIRTSGGALASLELRREDGYVLESQEISMNRVNLLLQNGWIAQIEAPTNGGTWAKYYGIKQEETNEHDLGPSKPADSQYWRESAAKNMMPVKCINSKRGEITQCQQHQPRVTTS